MHTQEHTLRLMMVVLASMRVWRQCQKMHASSEHAAYVLQAHMPLTLMLLSLCMMLGQSMHASEIVPCLVSTCNASAFGESITHLQLHCAHDEGSWGHISGDGRRSATATAPASGAPLAACPCPRSAPLRSAISGCCCLPAPALGPAPGLIGTCRPAPAPACASPPLCRWAICRPAPAPARASPSLGWWGFTCL